MNITQEGEMFAEMRKRGSKLPEMVQALQKAGWKTHHHHDNWYNGKTDDTGRPFITYSTHEAYEIIQQIKEKRNKDEEDE